MRPIFRQLLPLCLLLILIAGCKSTRLTVLEKNEPGRPFSRLLALYVTGPYDFTFFDSTQYNICIAGEFNNPGHINQRIQVEGWVADHLSSRYTSVITSSSLFDSSNYSYASFRKQIDSLGIDAILFVDLRNLRRDSSWYVPMVVQVPLGAGRPIPGLETGEPSQVDVVKGVFQFCLVGTKNNLPVWKAGTENPAVRFHSAGSLRPGYFSRVEKELVKEGFLARH